MTAPASAELLDLVDVGWIVWEPNIGQEYLRGGTVVAVNHDPVADTRVFTIIDSFHGRTRFTDLAEHELDPAMTQLPNSAVIRSHVRRMQREAGAAKGAVDTWQLRLTQTALRLMEIL
jgi:hypothetical protein